MLPKTIKVSHWGIATVHKDGVDRWVLEAEHWRALVKHDGDYWTVAAELSVSGNGYNPDVFGHKWDGEYQAEGFDLCETLSQALDSGEQNLIDTNYELGGGTTWEY